MIENVVISVSGNPYRAQLVGMENLISEAKLSDKPSRIELVNEVCRLISHYLGKTIIKKGGEANIWLFIIKLDDNDTRILKVLRGTGTMITIPYLNNDNNSESSLSSSIKIKFIFNFPYN